MTEIQKSKWDTIFDRVDIEIPWDDNIIINGETKTVESFIDSILLDIQAATWDAAREMEITETRVEAPPFPYTNRSIHSKYKDLTDYEQQQIK